MMSGTEQIYVGMPVYGLDKRPIGPVEGLLDDGFLVEGRHIPGAAIARVAEGAVHLKIVGGALLAHRDRSTAAIAEEPDRRGG
jgi:hypothetical protein